MKREIPSEHEEQVTFCQWLDLVGVTYFAVPNGSNKSITARRKFKKEGLKSGVPDMVILLEGGDALFIEMKRKKGGVLSKEQKKWIERLKVLGFKAYVAKGAVEAIAIVEKHLLSSKKNINHKQWKLL